MRLPETKKRAVKSKKVESMGATPVPILEEGTSVNPGAILGPRGSMLGSPSVVEKILGGVIPPVDKEKVDKLSLDQVMTKFFHIIAMVSIRFK